MNNWSCRISRIYYLLQFSCLSFPRPFFFNGAPSPCNLVFFSFDMIYYYYYYNSCRIILRTRMVVIIQSYGISILNTLVVAFVYKTLFRFVAFHTGRDWFKRKVGDWSVTWSNQKTRTKIAIYMENHERIAIHVLWNDNKKQDTDVA